LFDSACVTDTSFAHAWILGADFSQASGHYVDFSHVDDLRSLNLADASFDKVGVAGVKHRPIGWPSTGEIVHPEKASTLNVCQTSNPNLGLRIWEIVRGTS
jgi:hypothetical protein